MATLVKGRVGGAFCIPWDGELPRQPLPEVMALISCTRRNPVSHLKGAGLAGQGRRGRAKGKEQQAQDVQSKHPGPAMASPAANTSQKPHKGPGLQTSARGGRMAGLLVPASG